MKIGGKYNWKGQPERLVYLGKNWSGNGYWHQFSKVENPGVVWCEVLDEDIPSFEETRDAHQKEGGPRNPNAGHGHVFPRPDGVKARCGGPAICAECALDAARQKEGGQQG